MVAPVEVGEGGIGLLRQHQTRDRNAVAAACLAALEQWAGVRGPWGGEQGLRAPHGATGLRSEAQGA